MTNKLKQQKGISGVDIVVSIGIIIIFVSIIASVFLNLNNLNSQIVRRQTATNYAISILERVDKLYYSEVTDDAFNSENLQSVINISRGYNVNVTVQKYNELEGNEGKLDVVKNVTVRIEYKVR